MGTAHISTAKKNFPDATLILTTVMYQAIQREIDKTMT